MARLLSTALPGTGQGSVSLFNLFKYRSGDPSTHDKYMGDFKRNFGDSAGASVKFMGPLKSQFREKDERPSGNNNHGWQDASLVQYDSIYHYAHMLSTDTYQRLNQDKVRGLEDTGILLVSEGDAWYEKHFNSETPLGYRTSWSEAEFDDDGYDFMKMRLLLLTIVTKSLTFRLIQELYIPWIHMARSCELKTRLSRYQVHPGSFLVTEFSFTSSSIVGLPLLAKKKGGRPAPPK
jgi:hypothetical protein